MLKNPESSPGKVQPFLVVEDGPTILLPYDKHLDTVIDGANVQGFSLGALRRRIQRDMNQPLDSLPDDTYFFFPKEDEESTKNSTYSYFDGLVTLDSTRREIYIDSNLLTLPKLEYKLLEFFLLNPGTTFSLEQLQASVWDDTHSNNGTVRVHVMRVRDIFKQTGLPADSIIVTKKGLGYMFDDKADLN